MLGHANGGPGSEPTTAVFSFASTTASPPYDEATEEENQIQFNRNDLTGPNVLAQGPVTVEQRASPPLQLLHRQGELRPRPQARRMVLELHDQRQPAVEGVPGSVGDDPLSGRQPDDVTALVQ